MKTFIVGLFSLAVLASGAACTGLHKKVGSKLPPAGQGFCTANSGIFVVLVTNDAGITGFKCPKIRGKPIRQEPKLDPNVNIFVRSNDLGKVKKYRAEKESDPCIDWTVGGTRSYFCWDE